MQKLDMKEELSADIYTAASGRHTQEETSRPEMEILGCTKPQQLAGYLSTIAQMSLLQFADMIQLRAFQSCHAAGAQFVWHLILSEEQFHLQAW